MSCWNYSQGPVNSMASDNSCSFDEYDRLVKSLCVRALGLENYGFISSCSSSYDGDCSGSDSSDNGCNSSDSDSKRHNGEEEEEEKEEEEFGDTQLEKTMNELQSLSIQSLSSTDGVYDFKATSAMVLRGGARDETCKSYLKTGFFHMGNTIWSTNYCVESQSSGRNDYNWAKVQNSLDNSYLVEFDSLSKMLKDRITTPKKYISSDSEVRNIFSSYYPFKTREEEGNGKAKMVPWIDESNEVPTFVDETEYSWMHSTFQTGENHTRDHEYLLASSSPFATFVKP